MQFSQPTGFEHYGQPYALNTQFQFNGCPDIIGEGNVTSVISPDGGTQLLFLPTTQWWRPYPIPNVGNVNSPYWNNLGAWFVRSINNTFQPTLFSQLYQQPCGINHYPRGSNSDCSLNFPAPGFQLKFHNDTCTSTSDIHHFCPKQYNWFKKPQGCAAIQADLIPIAPMITSSVSHHEVVCTKPCNCTPIKSCSCVRKAEAKQNMCSCAQNSNSNTSEMSCDESNTQVRDKKKDKKKLHKLKKSKSKTKCHRKGRNASDKYVTTYTDQASGCAEEKGRETQTFNGCIPIHKIKSGEFIKMDTETKAWRGPKSHRRKKSMKSKSSATFSGVCESGCCSGSCTCDSDTEF